MKKRRIKIVIITVLAAAILAGAGTGAFFLLKKGGKPVGVYPLSDIAQTDMWMDNAQYEGNVRAENLQSVSLSDTQLLREVFVKEGDTVKKGDRLAAFDTTLSDLELERQKIEVQKLELTLTNKQAELRRIRNMTPYVPPAPQPEPAPQPLDPVALPKKLSGSGTAEKPYVYLWNEDCEYDEAFISQLLPLKEAATESGTDAEQADAAPVYEENSVTVVFQVREYDNPKGELLYTWGMTFDRHADGGWSFTVFEPDGGFENDEGEDVSLLPEPEPEERGYTAVEIAQMRAETEREIRETETKLKVERLNLKRLELEISTGVVTATMDGVIKSVASEEEAREEGRPVVTLSAGGAWYVNAYVGELDLQEISVGDEAEIQSWMNDGGAYRGKVKEISETPAEGGWYSSNGNPNVSYYPVTVEVDDSANLQEGDYVSVTFGSASENAGLYLEKPFIMTEDGRSFVFVMGEDGRLEKREVGTGRIYWGSTVEITRGLTMDDFIAFPYGKNVREGAKTEISDRSALYEYY